MNRKICVITGSRAEYGLLHLLMKEIKQDPTLELQTVATGMHLSKKYGETYKEIQSDDFIINKKVYSLVQDNSDAGTIYSVAKGLVGFVDVFKDLKPDLILLLGDRYEIFAAAVAAQIMKIPIGHIHGGESTEGLIDQAFRHSITKMSHLHFVAAEEYRQRVLQLGEDPTKVFLTGAPGLDRIKSMQLLTRDEIESDLKIKFLDKSLLITYHPVTLENNTEKCQINELLKALGQLSETTLIFTMPNSDPQSQNIREAITKFVMDHENAKAFTSLGQHRYFSLVAHVDAVIGNSSSGLIEVPSFKKPTIDIGDRQRGRLKPMSVVSCEPKEESILNAIEKIYSAEFLRSLTNVVNPFDFGGAATKILKVIKEVDLSNVLKKKFFDLVEK